ncbi:MAG: hypothetical protein ACN2B6_00185 [Rickettsiales bacterium]
MTDLLDVSSNPELNGVLLQIWYGPQSSIPAGWQVADGTNGTPDLTGAFPRAASSDADVTGSMVSHSTALPSSGFTTATKNITPSGSVSVSSASATSGDVPTTSGTWYDNTGDDVDGSGREYPYTTGSVSDENTSHSHSASFSGNSVNVGGQTVSGGDSETAPDHVYVYFIAYVGS